MAIRKLIGALIVVAAIALLFLITVAIAGLKGALAAWGTALLFVAAIVVGFFLLFV